jgi:hypothetical protein
LTETFLCDKELLEFLFIWLDPLQALLHVLCFLVIVHSEEDLAGLLIGEFFRDDELLFLA